MLSDWIHVALVDYYAQKTVYKHEKKKILSSLKFVFIENWPFVFCNISKSLKILSKKKNWIIEIL